MTKNCKHTNWFICLICYQLFNLWNQVFRTQIHAKNNTKLFNPSKIYDYIFNLFSLYFLRSIINIFQVQFGFDNRPGLNELETYLTEIAAKTDVPQFNSSFTNMFTNSSTNNSTHSNNTTPLQQTSEYNVFNSDEADKKLLQLIMARFSGSNLEQTRRLDHFEVSQLMTQECKFFNGYETSFTTCRMLSILTQYLIISNCFWCLVEGIFLALLMELRVFFYGFISYRMVF